MSPDKHIGLQCPLPIADYPRILLAHGGGGRLMHQLIDKIFATAFDNPDLETGHDGAVINSGGRHLAFTTDSFVVDPLFFPGGDIGSLAVNGTVNDLAMCGARPDYLSAGFIIEEGLATTDLWQIACSMKRAVAQSGVRIVTGDTKVVEKGRGHGLFINTAGVGAIIANKTIGPGRIRTGDKIIINGDIGRHGMAIMARREGLAFESDIESDCAPLSREVLALLETGIEIHCLRDLTRGGLATTMVELANSSGYDVAIEAGAVPVREDVRGACEILGFDPLYVANEGRFAAFVEAKDVLKAMEILAKIAPQNKAAVIGEVREGEGMAVLRGALGVETVLDMLSGEQLPRIC